MEDYEIKQLLKRFKESDIYKMWIPDRKEKHDLNSVWIKYEEIKKMPDEKLREKFLEYYGGGEGRQTLNQVWRDRIIREVGRFREVLLYLLDEKIPLEQRFSEVVGGERHIEGFGKALASTFLMDSDIEKYCLWNSKTEMGFNVLGWGIPYESTDSWGRKYTKVLERLRQLRDEIGSGLNLDYLDVDLFLHWIAAEDEGKEAVKAIKAEPLEKAGIELKLREELIHTLVEYNFQSIFPNLELYQEDPEQTGSKFRAPPAGEIDFLAVDKNTKNFVVIELKAGEAGDGAVGQVLGYMMWVKENLAKDREVRGIILALGLTNRARYALKLLPSVEFKKLTLTVE